MPRHGLAALLGDGLTLLLGVVEAVLLGHVVALLVADHVARLRWHVLALLPLHLGGLENRMRRGWLLTLGGSVCLPVWARLHTSGRRRCGKQAESLRYTVACGRVVGLVQTDGGLVF